ncbi:MAG: phage tail protein I, partial [Oscillospiraceae bacterium]|nr:phage tail protein I [Oscillospiraceae bacterium]
MNERVRHGLDMESLLSALPPPLRDAPALRALAATAAKALSFEAEEVDRLRIYTRLDRLPEELLDILAYDFKVDWWNPDYTLEEKRRVLRDSWYVHRHMGTRAAVETALKAVYRDAAILEWFEYGGQPGYFRLWTDVTNEDFIPALRREILRRMNYYKRLGAHLESAGYYMKAEPARAWAYAAYGGQIQKRWAEIVPPPGVRPPEAEVTAIYGGVL